MATLVLSTVGTILGGPVGGAIGSLLGQSIDQQLFGPGPRHGPRLGDLAVQTSSYGTPIPRLFGTMRVAGSIVWSTDLQESSQTQGAKGQPDTVTYSYSVSFAVALSSRPILGVKRIWADGKLIRTAEGVFTVSTTFRFYDGSQDQPVDPLIATIEGTDSTPAYRGSALAVFEHLDLAEFGNRIPFLTFEVVADEGPVPAADILSDSSGGAIDCSAPHVLNGYAAYGSTIGSAIEPLLDILGIPLFDSGRQLISPSAITLEPGSDELGCGVGEEHRARTERSHAPALTLPASLSLNYYDPDREYQAGLARASVDSLASTAANIELPAVLESGHAKGLAETCLARRWAERDRLTLRLPQAYLDLRPGTLIRAAALADGWKAERVSIEGFSVAIELRPVHAMIGELSADPGRVLPSEGVVPTPTTTSVVELPDDGSGTADSPVVVVAASNGGSGSRSVPLTVEVGGSEPMSISSSTAAVQGVALNALGDGQSALIDGIGSVVVELASDAWLESRDLGALVEGANLALLGNELIQFSSALALGSRQFRLSGLLRGRRGTEWAMGLHQSGERFLLIERAALHRLAITSAQTGARLKVTPRGLSDGQAEATELVVTGEAMRPLSPVRLRAAFLPDGSLECSWTRRSRHGWAWLDSVDAPLDVSVELYRVTVKGAAGALAVETAINDATFAPGEVAALGPGNLEIGVVQVGDLAVSRPAQLTLNSQG